MGAMEVCCRFLNVLLIFGMFLRIHAQDQDPKLFYEGKLMFEMGEPIKSLADSKQIHLPYNISYFGSSYNKLFISKDGLIGFEKNIKYRDVIIWSEGNFMEDLDKPFIAPFYYSAYYSYTTDLPIVGQVYSRAIFKEQMNQDDAHYTANLRLLTYLNEYIPTTVINAPSNFEADIVVVVTWKDVTDKASCGVSCSAPGTATFQATIVANRDHTYVIFNYEKMNIPFQQTYQAGFNGGHRRGWFNVIPCQEECTRHLNASRVNDLPDMKGSDIRGRFILDVDHEILIRGGCLPDDIQAGTLEVYPTEVGMWGGEVLQVSGRCLDKTAPIYCKFSYIGEPDQPVTLYRQTNGQMVTTMKGFCEVPYLSWVGPTLVSWSSDTIDWTAQRTITVVLPSAVKPVLQIPEDVTKPWFSRDSSSITVKWDPASFSEGAGAKVMISLMGYWEDEDNKQVHYDFIKNLGQVDNQAGSFTFDVNQYRCTEECLKHRLGWIEVRLLPDFYSQAADRIVLRYGEIPLGWYANEQLTQEMGSDWSNQICRQWHNQDSADESWVGELLPCPCNLDQALADFGRFKVDPGCDLFHGSVCSYHIGAKHCVRSIQPTKHGAGNQCCYNHDGTLRYSQLSYQGSTPDRGHVWGSRPYGKPDLVPSLSHWKHDVISFYDCCLWNDYDLCDLYMEQRPTIDCMSYQSPGIGFIRGDPHITTFNGQTYHFGGRGDFHLVKVPGLDIQGRFEAPLGTHTPTGTSGVGSGNKEQGTSRLSRVALRGEGVSEVLIWPAPLRASHTRGLDVLVDHNRVFFFNHEAMVQEFSGGLTIVNNAPSASDNKHDNFTVLLPNQVGVNVVNVNGLLHAAISLPPEMKSQVGMGLLGNFDDNSGNDYMLANGHVIAIDTSNKDLHINFANTWRVAKVDSLFRDALDANAFDNYEPIYSYDDIPFDYDDPISDSSINSLCQDNENCKWDYKITGSREVATATLDADIQIHYMKESMSKAENCGLPEIGRMAILNNYNFSAGQGVTVTGCEHDKDFAGQATYTCVKERLEVAKEQGRDDYGQQVVDPIDLTTYIVHWVPRPGVACSDSSSDEANMTLIIGLVVGIAGGLILIGIIIGIIVYRKKKTGTDSPRAAPRRDGRDTRDPAAAEAMLSSVVERSPVYKPSGDPVRIKSGRMSNSKVQGSSV